MIKKVVIPAAGLGTRLLPITKELPKEMLPVFLNKGYGSATERKACLKPMLQAVFEQSYLAGFREFCIVVGRGKRAIEDHFTPDWVFVEYLKSRNKARLDELQEFYRKINDSTMVFVNQPEPKGFGDAVLKARAFTGDEDFVVHAGDNLILSKNNSHLKRLVETFEDLNAEAILFVKRTKEPWKYGVVEVDAQVCDQVFRVKGIVEKPRAPVSNIAVVAVYVFRPSIYRAIENVKRDERGEIQLTDAICGLVEEGHPVYAVELVKEKRIDIGDAEEYWDALKTTYTF